MLREFLQTWQTLVGGLLLTGRHFGRAGTRRNQLGIQAAGYFDRPDGPVTVQYPRETVPTPVNGRYQLHLEEDDCIVCDKCARICPVDCIDIDGFKAVDDLGTTSDGSKKRLELATFDIDLAKCCFCGLCTTVCPTECLTMTPEYDYSHFEREALNFEFATMTPEAEAEKRAKLAESLANKQAATQVGTGNKKKIVLKTRPQDADA